LENVGEVGLVVKLLLNLTPEHSRAEERAGVNIQPVAAAGQSFHERPQAGVDGQ